MKKKWLHILLAVCLVFSMIVPTSFTALAATATYTFDDLLYQSSYGTTYEVDGNGAVNLTFASQYQEIKYDLPSPIDMSECTEIIISAKADHAIAFKLYDASGEQAYVKYNCTAENKTDFALAPALDTKITSLGIMAQSDVENATATIYSISFELTSSSDTTEDVADGSANLLNTYGDLFGRSGNCVSLNQLQNKAILKEIKRQYNSVTLENEMKPDYILGSSATLISISEAKKLGYYIPDNYTETTVPKINFATVDKAMQICYENGIGMRAHTLVWHSQTPSWLFRTGYTASGSYVSTDVMDARLEFYVKTVINHVYGSEYGDCVYAWDIANEYLHATNSGWEGVYGAQGTTPVFVKEAFQFANEALKKLGIRDEISLFYNDYNTYMVADDIVTMLNYVNKEEKLCDGVGMQSHLDTSYPSASLFKSTLKKFCDAGFEVQITELDVTNTSDASQATYLYNLMSGILAVKKAGGNITGLTIWGLYDTVSWRASKNPLLYSSLTTPKASYTSVLKAYTDAGYTVSEPTTAPTATPTVKPTTAPTATPTVKPTTAPTATPTVKPTTAPTATPTVKPTAVPTATPTVKPTTVPTATPTPVPTEKPQKGLELSTQAFSWNTGYVANMVITNTTGTTTNGWTLVLKKADFNISSIWCCQYKVVGDEILITPESWNKTLFNGGKVFIGFIGMGSFHKDFTYEIRY